MEILLLAMVVGWAIKNGVKDLVHTGATAVCAVQGKPAPSWGSNRRMKRPDGAATRYFRELWNDSWDGALAKHRERNARRDVASVADSGTAMRSFFAGNFRDGRRFAHRKWHATWIRLRILRNLKKKTRPRPGQQTVPGTIVPNAQDEDGDGPDFRPGPDPHVVPGEDGRTDLRFGDDPTDPTGTKECPECHGAGVVDGEICPSCRDRQEQRGAHRLDQIKGPGCSYCNGTGLVGYWPCRKCTKQDEPNPGPESVPDYVPDFDATPTTEGTTTMSTATGEVTGLDTAIRFCEDSARGYQAQIHQIEIAKASLTAAEAMAVAGPLQSAMEMTEAAASAMKQAEAELRKQIPIAELYRANPGAATKDFMLQG